MVCSEGKNGGTNSLEAYRELLEESFRERRAATVPEAANRIEPMTGILRGPTQTRLFAKKVNLRWQRIAAIPAPLKKVSRNM